MTSAPAATIVIFGAAGDLTLRLLMPAVYDLAVAGRLEPATRFVGADHNERTAKAWEHELRAAVRTYVREKHAAFDREAWTFVADRLAYRKLDFTQAGDYAGFADEIPATASAVFYLATAPKFFEDIARNLAQNGLLRESDGAFRRLAIEKPFGRDVRSAAALEQTLTSVASDAQIFRVDHFLGKEAVRGLPALRYANRFLEPLLDGRSVASVQITAAETGGVEERGPFYETTGALRDMVPNHLFSLLTLVAMEWPASPESEAQRDAKVALLHALRPLAPGDAVRGQYAKGRIGGRRVAAYRDEDRVARDSATETYAAARVFVDNERWRGVPFYLRTGKRLAARTTTIALILRAQDLTNEPERIVFEIDPDGGLDLHFAAKRPGVAMELGPARAGFRYATTFDEPPNTGYESLLFEILGGRQTYFQRSDMIAREWELLEPVLVAWERDARGLEFYAAGSGGPAAADALLAIAGDRWLPLAAPGDAKRSRERRRKTPRT